MSNGLKNPGVSSKKKNNPTGFVQTSEKCQTGAVEIQKGKPSEENPSRESSGPKLKYAVSGEEKY